MSEQGTGHNWLLPHHPLLITKGSSERKLDMVKVGEKELYG